MSDWSRRSLLHASLASVMLHAVLLIGVVPTFPARMEAAAMRLEAVLNSAVSAKPVALLQPRPQTPALHPPQQPTTSMVKAAPVESTVLAVPGVVAELATQRAPVHEAAAVSSVARDAGAAPPGASSQASQGLSADDLRQYRLSLAIAARRFKRYPALARERGWEGTSEVAINLISALPAPQIVLMGSSGRKVLDEQAIEMVVQAARATELPEGLKGRDFRVVLPVKFSLEDY